jgi:predicted nuclease with TOPRIM domain
MDTLSQDLQLKERELQQVMEQCRRHEGESAGKSITLDSLSLEYEQLQTENDNLSKKLLTEIRTCQELRREVENFNIASPRLVHQNGVDAVSVSKPSILSTPLKNQETAISSSSSLNKATASTTELALLQSNLIKVVSTQEYANNYFISTIH